MDKKALQNHELDRIGRNLLGAARISDDEIERIISAPYLFEAVKTGIKKETDRRKPRAVWFWNWQTAAGALAVLTLAIVVTAVIFFRASIPAELVQETPNPEIEATVAPTEIAETKETKIVQRAAYKGETSKPKDQTRKPKPVKQQQFENAEGEFYSLTLGGNWEADAENLRIVRAELTRAELFALGINLPVENEAVKVKTDLLVGANGVPKAIRFVE